MANTPNLTDDQLLGRLRNFEDSFVERKSSGDWKKDALKTAVAFANSCPPETTGILFIGVKNDGSIEFLIVIPLKRDGPSPARFRREGVPEKYPVQWYR